MSTTKTFTVVSTKTKESQQQQTAQANPSKLDPQSPASYGVGGTPPAPAGRRYS